jgi:hypothetical protein
MTEMLAQVEALIAGYRRKEFGITTFRVELFKIVHEIAKLEEQTRVVAVKPYPKEGS